MCKESKKIYNKKCVFQGRIFVLNKRMRHMTHSYFLRMTGKETVSNFNFTFSITKLSHYRISTTLSPLNSPATIHPAELQ